MKTTFRNINTYFIILYLYWIVFEWPLLSRINNIGVINSIRSIIDLFPFFFMILNILLQKWKIKIHEIKIFIIILSILIIAAISILIEGYNFLSAVKIISVSFRYVPFLVLIRLSAPKLKDKFYKQVKIIFWIIVCLTIFEIANKSLFMKIFLPSPGIFNESLPTIYYSKRFEISCTFINTIDFSFFIIAISNYYIIQTKNKKKTFFIYVISLILVFLSFSVASLLCMIIVGLFLFRKNQLFWVISIVIIAAGILSNPRIVSMMIDTSSIESFIQISTKYSRIGYFTKLMPEFFKGNIKDILLGMGLNNNIINRKLLGYVDLPLMLTFEENNIKLLKDVYWIGIIITEGIIVMLLYLNIFHIIYIKGKKMLEIKDAKFVGLMILIILFLGLFNQVLDVKSFSFSFWVIIGIMFKQGYEKRSIENLKRKIIK